jgi:hypothetical protein
LLLHDGNADFLVLANLPGCWTPATDRTLLDDDLFTGHRHIHRLVLLNYFLPKPHFAGLDPLLLHPQLLFAKLDMLLVLETTARIGVLDLISLFFT